MKCTPTLAAAHFITVVRNIGGSKPHKRPDGKI